MADNVIARKSGNWNAVSTLPSVNLTPMGGTMLPTPYPVISPLAPSQGTIGSVKANSNTVWGFDPTKAPATKGDEAGTGKGVKSGTVGKDSWAQEKSSTVKAEDKKVVRHDDKADMEGDKEAKEKEEMKKRQECREEQVKAGAASKNPEIRARAARFSENISGAQYAGLSDNVYDPTKARLGWINESNNPEFLRSQGIRQSDLSGPGAYRAQVYRPDPAVWGDNPRFGTTVAFQGTSGVFNGDIGANVGQGLNLGSEYYRRAVSIGRSTYAHGTRVTFTGHSLGGGLASAASQASGYRGFTFNPSGLSSGTVRYPRGTGSQIRAYYVRGEALRGAQQPGVIGALGSFGTTLITGAIMPNAVGIPHELSASSFSPINRHKMGDVMNGIEEQKREDQRAIANDTGKEC
jgi:hypothetical protein